MLFDAKKPSFRIDRVAWNQKWENDLADLYGTGQVPVFRGHRIDVGSKESFSKLAKSDSTAHIMASMGQELCRLQHDLTRQTAMRFAERDFESRWKSCTQQDKWLIEGLVRTCDITTDFEPRRAYCPETALFRLKQDSGQGFLDLLQSLALPDTESVPKTYHFVPSTIFDQMNGANSRPPKHLDARSKRGYELIKSLHHLGRSYFLTAFAWNTLLAFFDLKEDAHITKTFRDRLGNKVDNKKFGTPGSPFDTEEAHEKYQEEYGQAIHVCSVCSQTAEGAGVEKLLHCSRCKAIKRRVFYCGKSCQKSDWKTHKKICGNKEALLSSVLSPNAVESTKNTGKWPDPKPGYHRTPFLLQQLRLLSKHPEEDYFLIRPAPEPDRAIHLPPDVQIAFMQAFNKAICEHDPESAWAMYAFLEVFLRKTGQTDIVPPEELKTQMNKEFRVDLDVLIEQHPPIRERKPRFKVVHMSS